MNEKAVIYCRVSTEEERQLNALERQIDELRSSVLANGWVLVDEYVDEGKTGTMTKRRDEYKRLFQDLSSNKFDIIVIKSQDRLMRSTMDWYIFIDRLVRSNKRLFFNLENKFYSPEDALITGIKAILAEEYSRDLSKKINNAHYHRQKNKGTVMLTSNTWGYDKVGKEIVINEDEANIVKLMFQLCADGCGSRTVAKVLTRNHIFSRSGQPFNDSTIRRIIRNPLFKGTAIMNKKHFDFNTKRNIYNNETEWIYKDNAVPPIVSEELWENANREMDKRTRINRSAEIMGEKRGLKIGDHPLSSKIICNECGGVYWRTRYRHRDGGQVINWCCCEYVRNGRKTPSPYRRNYKMKIRIEGRGCDNIHINNNDLEAILEEVANQFYGRKDSLISDAVRILSASVENPNMNKLRKLKEERDILQEKRAKLLDKYLDDSIARDIYQSKDAEILAQATELEKQILYEEKEQSKIQSLDVRIEALRTEIGRIVNEEFAFQFLCRHITKVYVSPDKMLIQYDTFPDTNIHIEALNYRKKRYSICTDEVDA